jgi:hypothetical protein
MASWSRVKEKKLKRASQEGVKLRSEWEETHLRTFCAEEKRARFGSRRRSSNPARIGDSRGGYAEYLVGNDVEVWRAERPFFLDVGGCFKML